MRLAESREEARAEVAARVDMSNRPKGDCRCRSLILTLGEIGRWAGTGKRTEVSNGDVASGAGKVEVAFRLFANV